MDKYDEYKNRICLIGSLPQHKIINITNNRGALFYDKDRTLSHRMDVVTGSIIDQNAVYPTLAYSNSEIRTHLEKKSNQGLGGAFNRIASSFN